LRESEWSSVTRPRAELEMAASGSFMIDVWRNLHRDSQNRGHAT